MALLSLVVIIGFLSILFFYGKKWRLYRVAKRFPGPKALPFIGNAHFLAGNNAEILDKIRLLFDAYPSPFRFWMGHKLLVCIYDPEQLKIILHSPKAIEKEELYKFARPWLGTGLFSAPASKWKVHRKLIMPTFNPRILESFVEVFAQQSEIMVDQMKVEIDGDEFDIFNYVSLCTLDIICETAMGVTVKAQTGGDPSYIESAKTIFEIIFARMCKVWLHPDFVFKRTHWSRTQQECIDYMHGVTNEVIRKKKVKMESQAAKEDKRKAFLDLLMELSKDGAKLTDEELREEVDTMMIAGNDTTAQVNTWVMFMLANFPEVQAKCYQELCDIYGEDINGDISVKNEDLNRMEYLERVIKETMRLFPVPAVILRRLTDDLDVGEYTLPKDCSIVLGILRLHRSEEYWENPLEFNPDRFLPEEVAKRHPYSYIPFSAGPRNCLGLRYAMMAMKALLSTVLRHYVLKKDKLVKIEDVKLKADIMLKPVETIMLKIERRIR